MDVNLLTFDSGLDQLEAIVQKLESESLCLEEAIQCYEDGVKLSETLQRQLAEAKRKVDVLRQGSGGEYTAEPMEGESE